MAIKSVFLASLIVLVVYFQKESDQQKKLSISDYKGPPDLSVSFLAFTTCGVFYKIFREGICSNNKIRVKLSTELRFFEYKSWIKSNKIKDKDELNGLLDHEQGHYDLFQVYELNFKFLVENRSFSKDRYKFEIDSLYNEMFKHYDAMQHQYDIESEGMRNKAKQIEWKFRIQKMYLAAKHGKFE